MGLAGAIVRVHTEGREGTDMITTAMTEFLEAALYMNACDRMTDADFHRLLEEYGYKIVKDMGYKIKLMDVEDNGFHYIFC